MPQMAIIQPATPQGPPQTRTAEATGNKEQNTFSPHLDKAVADNKKQQQVDQQESRTNFSAKTDKKLSTENDSPPVPAQESEDTPDIAAAADTAVAADFADATDTTDAADTEVAAGTVMAVKTAEAVDAIKLSERPDAISGQLSVPVADTDKSRPIAITTVSAQLQPIEATVQTPQNTSVTGPGTIGPEPIPAEFLSAITEPTREIAIKPTAAKTQTALLDQLQRIIDQADETGTVSITKAMDTTFVNSFRSNIHGLLLSTPAENPTQGILSGNTTTSGMTANSLLFADTQGAEEVATRPTQQLTGIRHEAQQQFFNSRIVAKDLSDNKQNFQDHQPGDKLPQPAQQTISVGGQSGPSSVLLNGSEQTNTFSQIVTTIQPTTAQQTTETAKPILLPSGTIVQEEEIIQQMSHKLQISSRNMDSRINLRLHPAELGSLKIDLTVKEGSIRANVVAQSQHTTEILEKNMAKLKTVLENQGFTVDEISITTESESVADFNLFDRQLFSHNDYTPKAAKERREEEAVFTLTDTIFAAPTISTGVNVKI